MLAGRLHGWAFSVKVPDAVTGLAVARGVRTALQEAPKARTGADWELRRHGDGYCLLHGGSPVVEHDHLVAVVKRLASQLDLHAAANSHEFVAIHAGVVALDGRAVVIPGRSWSGKTTLVGKLVEAGALYLSDEYALLDADGRVHPFARDLGVRRNGVSVPTPVTALGGQASTAPAPVALIASLIRSEDGWSVRRRSVGEAVLDLMEHALAARLRPREVLSVVAGVSERAPRRIRGTRGDAADAAARLLRML